jgi:hypothetical protein
MLIGQGVKLIERAHQRLASSWEDLWCLGLQRSKILSLLLPPKPSILLSAFRPRGVPGPTSKFVTARPSPDGLAQNGTQGENAARVILRQGECAHSKGYKRSRERERERESEPVRQLVLPRDPPFSRMKALDLPFIDGRRGSRCIMGGVAMR